MAADNETDAHAIIFGLSRTEDERSLAAFLKLFCSKQLTDTLLPRMTDAEIGQTVDFLSGIMRNHLSEQEYHTLFLGDRHRDH